MLTFDSENPGTRLIIAMLDSLGDALLLCDADLLILAANRAAADLLGITKNDLVGKRTSDMLAGCTPPDSGPPHDGGTHLEWQCRARSVTGPLLHVCARRLCDEPSHLLGWTLRLRRSAETQAPPEFVGRSTAAQELLEFTSRIASSRANSILLVGESGTGKDLIAKRLHALSTRAGAAYVPINCATLPEPLLESELFGHEKGAFTGAEGTHEGLLETANGGTIFLDEIGELSLPLQAKLLRVLEERTFRRVGGNQDRRVDLRVICATNRDLEKEMEERRFRADLYYRLNVVQIRLPALRERPDDISLLAAHFLKHFSALHRRSVDKIHPSALRVLELYAWPGNVRELRNVMERAVLVESSPTLMPESLSIAESVGSGRRGHKSLGARFSLSKSEHDLIAAALAHTDGNQTRAASLLGIGRFSLRYKMKKFGMLGSEDAQPAPAAGAATQAAAGSAALAGNVAPPEEPADNGEVRH